MFLVDDELVVSLRKDEDHPARRLLCTDFGYDSSLFEGICPAAKNL